ncbi:hypothetical protein Gorai_018723, partial [Gossypium raimondii]|nr:hypothetical protein [Gossypium raimondii]
MVYITSWDEFVERTVQLFRADPESTRYCMKYRHCDGKLVLKVTDNKEFLGLELSPKVQCAVMAMVRYGLVVKDAVDKNPRLLKYLKLNCLKFKTDQAQDARKMEKLNNIFFTLMARGPD